MLHCGPFVNIADNAAHVAANLFAYDRHAAIDSQVLDRSLGAGIPSSVAQLSEQAPRPMVVFAVQSNVYLQIGDRVSAAVKNTLETITAADGCPVVTLQTDVVPQRQGPTLECLILADLAVDQQGKAVQLRRRFDGIRFLRNRFFVVPAYICPDEVILDAYVIRDIYAAAAALPLSHLVGRLKHDLCFCRAGQCP